MTEFHKDHHQSRRNLAIWLHKSEEETAIDLHFISAVLFSIEWKCQTDRINDENDGDADEKKKEGLGHIRDI